jgi:hypothetical protein
MSQICFKLHQLFNSLPRFHVPFDINEIPRNGIYALFEQGEYAHGVNRIVRIGSHTGDNQLRSRLQQHFIHENKDRSIFRKNIGRAFLNKSKDPYLKEWELDLTSHHAKSKYSGVIDAVKQSRIEQQVTEYLQRNFSFTVFHVDDKANRLIWESKIISSISLCGECKPSQEWLGKYSPKDKIRESGLWLVNELYKQCLQDNEFAILEREILS